MSIVLTQSARQDLTEIHEFIATDSPSAAIRTINQLFAIIQKLDRGDLKGPEARLSDGRRVRRWSVPPYRIYYRRSTRRTVIVRVFHQARRPLEEEGDQ